MEVQPECLACVFNRVLFEVERTDSSKKWMVMEKVLRILCDSYPSNIRSAKVWTKIHGTVYEILGRDPYEDLKKRSNEIALKMYPFVREIYLNAEDKLRSAELISIAGNVLDFGVAGVYDPEFFETKFIEIYNEGFGHDDTDKLEKYLKEGANVTYITDNCGEIVFDKIMIEELKNRKCRVSVVVRGKPIISDATIEDAIEVGIDKIADELLSTEIFALGVDLERIPYSLLNKLRNSDIIIAKGMGNYESICDDLKPIAYLLRTKCQPVARALGVPYNKNIVKVIE